MNIIQLKQQSLDALFPNAFDFVELEDIGKSIIEIIDFDPRLGSSMVLKTSDEFPPGFPDGVRMPGNKTICRFDPLEILAWVRDAENELHKASDEAYRAKWVEIERQRAIQRAHDDAREVESLASETAEQARKYYQTMESSRKKEMAKF